MRLFALLALLATPVSAWEHSFENGICRLDHTEPGAEVLVSYTPAQGLYAITVTQPAAWMPSLLFSIDFNGSRSLSISTDRQIYEGSALTVTDRGFGNVLDGLEFNDTATVRLGDQILTVSLEGAAPEVRKFRDCTDAALT